ncbi:MAG: NAD(P)/FAD-dependent oxidoreductase [Pseudomonadota bacterium]
MSRIGIVGCGPAGLAVALLLTRQGHDVTLYEKFSRPRPLGSGLILQPTGQAVLSELALLDTLTAVGKRIDRIHGVSMPREKTVLDVDYAALGSDLHGIGVLRGALFEVLYSAVVAADIPIQIETDVTSVKLTPNSITPLTANGDYLEAVDLLIDASGSSSRLRAFATKPSNRRELMYGAVWANVDWPGEPFAGNTLAQRYVAAHTMVGVLPVGRLNREHPDQAAFFWSLRVRDYPHWLGQSIDTFQRDIINIWPDVAPIAEQLTDHASLTMAAYGHCTLPAPYNSRLAFIGDAAHSTSPQLGQGANMALLDAWALAQAIDRDGIAAGLAQYARVRRWHVRAFQLASLSMTPFYQSDSRLLAELRDLLFDPVSKLPIVKRIVAGLISGLLASPPNDLNYRSVAKRTSA